MRRRRKLGSAVIASLLVMWLSYRGTAADERYVLASDPPSISSFNISTSQVLGTIPLKGRPVTALMHRPSRTLYVLSHFPPQKGDRGDGSSELTAIDPARREVLATISVPARVSALFISDDDRDLVCLSAGRDTSRGDPAVAGSLAIIDAATRVVVGTAALTRPIQQVLATKDLSSIFVLQPAGLRDVNKLPAQVMEPAQLSVFHGPALAAGPVMEMPDVPTAMALSSDTDWVYVLDRGYHNNHSSKHLGFWGGIRDGWVKKDNAANHRDGVLHVFNARSGAREATLTLGNSPWKLLVDAVTNSVVVMGYADDEVHGRLHEIRGKEIVGTTDVGEWLQDVLRVPALPGRLAVAHDEIQFLPDPEHGQPFTVRLNPATTAPTKDSHDKGLEAWPTEVHYVPDNATFIMGLDDVGWLPPSRSYPAGPTRLPKEEVGLVNRRSGMTQRIKLGRSGVRFTKGLKSAAIGFGFALGTGAIGYGLGSPAVVYVYPTDPLGLRRRSMNEKIVVSRDGRFAYGLNRGTNDVTIVAVEDGSVIDRIDLGGMPDFISMAPGGQFVYAYAGNDITLIDTATNQVHLRHHVSEAKITGMMQDEDKQLLFGLTATSLVVIDAKEGRLLGTVSVLGPRLVIIPEGREAPMLLDTKS